MSDFESKNFTKCQISKLKKYNASDFEMNKLQCVRFWIKNFSMSDFEKRFAFKISRSGSFYSVKTTYFAILVLFQKACFWIEDFTTCQMYLSQPNVLTTFFSIKPCHYGAYNIFVFRMKHSPPFKQNFFWSFSQGIWLNPLFSLNGLEMCENLLLLVKSLITKLQLFSSHTCLTSFW